MAPPTDSTSDALIIGCGYLGRRVAARWVAGGRRVHALTRRNADTLAQLGLVPVPGDVLDSVSLRALPSVGTVLYAVGMDRTSGATMRDVYVTGLSHVLAALPPCRRFIYVSSTGVYGQTDGGWIDETAATEPREESGRVVLAAEQVIRERFPAAVVLRFAGIYGPDRLLRAAALRAGEPLVGDPDKWLNLIHVQDGAEAVIRAETDAPAGDTYHVADNTPVTRREFYTHLASLLGGPPAAFEPRPEPGSANRRVSNARLRALGWVPSFPSYREGLAASL